MDSFHFLRPTWLLACIPLLLLLWLLWRQRLSSQAWKSFCDPELLPHLLVGENGAARRWLVFLIGIAGLLSIIALAGPVWEQREQPVFREQSALVIALDLSRSMDAQDIKPNRLTRARHKLTDILQQRREGQTALLVYAALPFVITPLTEDRSTILSQVNSLDTALMPSQGSRPDLVVTKVIELLDQAGHSRGDILLLTDGIGNTAIDDILAPLKGTGHRLSTLAIGTEAGAPIPLTQGGFLKGPGGEIVIPRLNPDELRSLAAQGGGRFSALTLDDRDIHHLLAPLESHDVTHQDESTGLTADQWREEGPWLLLIILPLAAFAFRRGYIAVVLLLLLPPPPANAVDWQNLWLRQDQRASQAMEQGQHQQAAELFSNPEWQAMAHYRAEEYGKAIERLEGIETADALYNKGNALAKNQRLEEALQAYDQSLEINPDNNDAQHNKELVKQRLEQQQQQQNQEQQQAGENADNQENSEDQQQSGEQNQQQGEDKSNSQAQKDNQQQQESDDGASEQKQPSQQAESGQEPEEPNNSEASQADNSEQDPAKDQHEESEQAEAAATELAENKSAIDPATEQWLKRIPDDPSGLLRRKFRYQYRNMGKNNREQQPW
jgi:Ca-activated chloride channel family protein